MSENSSNETITLEYLDEIHDAFNRHDVEAVVGYFAEDGVFRLARGDDGFGRKPTGKAEIRDFLNDRFRAIGDMHWEASATWFSGNRATSEWLVTATLPNGDKLELSGCDLYEFRGRQIIKKDTYWKAIDQSI
jgi:ketosteroid isomerase-like protein